jgi:hypothetical protein
MKRMTGSAVRLSGWLFLFFLIPSFASATNMADCRECHTGNVGEEHHLLLASENIGCDYCHSWVYVNYAYIFQADRNCTACHGGIDHEGAHDRTEFAPGKGSESACALCHFEIVGEHLERGYDCNTCHNSADPFIVDVVHADRVVYCMDCHRDAAAPFALHNADHDGVCALCHVLPEKADDLPLSVHSRPQVSCVGCHRLGSDDAARNTLFTLPVNAGEGEPPDYDYDPSGYLLGRCLNCHLDKSGHISSKVTSGCLPCHFSSAQDSWPLADNDWFGSTSWGHNLQPKSRGGGGRGGR